MRDRRGRTGRRAATAALLAALAALCGCGTRTTVLYEKGDGSPGYVRVTESLTRSREVHEGLEPRFFLQATRLTPAWVSAFADEYSRIYYADRERIERTVPAWRREAEENDLFFVALFTPDDRQNDLEKPGTLWSLRLVRGDETEVAPSSVRRMRLAPDEAARFFPDFSHWYRGYEVAFPKPPRTGGGAPSAPVRLVLLGVKGRAVLSWE